MPKTPLSSEHRSVERLLRDLRRRPIARAAVVAYFRDQVASLVFGPVDARIVELLGRAIEAEPPDDGGRVRFSALDDTEDARIGRESKRGVGMRRKGNWLISGIRSGTFGHDLRGLVAVVVDSREGVRAFSEGQAPALAPVLRGQQDLLDVLSARGSQAHTRWFRAAGPVLASFVPLPHPSNLAALFAD